MFNSNLRLNGSDRRTGFARLAVVWLIGCLTTAGFLAVGGLDALSRADRHVAAPQVQPVAYTWASGNHYEAIERVRVGQRVMTPLTDPSRPSPTEVDPATWQLLRLRSDARWDDGTTDPIDVELLRPAQWLRANGVAVGARVPVPVDLADIGSAGDPNAMAEVTSVGPCPSVLPGPGRVVLATITHLNAEPLDLTISASDGRREVVHTTGPHRFYSEDRGAWARARDLAAGERLRGETGPVAVVSAEARPGPVRVYNLTIEGEHVFFVSRLGLLTHNQSSPGPPPTGGQTPCPTNKPSLTAHKNALDQVHDEVGKLPKGSPGKFGSPQAGTSKKGYRLDPPHPTAPPGSPEEGPHINWWDWTGGKKGSGGKSGAVPIVEP